MRNKFFSPLKRKSWINNYSHQRPLLADCWLFSFATFVVSQISKAELLLCRKTVISFLSARSSDLDLVEKNVTSNIEKQYTNFPLMKVFNSWKSSYLYEHFFIFLLIEKRSIWWWTLIKQWWRLRLRWLFWAWHCSSFILKIGCG